MAPISEILGKLAGTLRVPILTPEYEIVLTLLDYPGLTAEQLTERSSLSRAGFFNTLDRLKSRGVIVASSSQIDRRSKIYRLSQDTYGLIISRFTEYHLVYDLFEKGIRRDFHFIKEKITSNHQAQIYNFSCEFQIIFYVYLVPRLSNSHLRKLVDASDTKFAVSLQNLLSKGIVNFTTDEEDGRRKLYDIGTDIRKIMTNVHEDIFDWLDNTVGKREEKPLRQSGIFPLSSPAEDGV